MRPLCSRGTARAIFPEGPSASAWSSRFPSLHAGRGWNVYAPVEHGRWGLHRCEVLDLDDGLIEAAGLSGPTGDPIVHWTPGTEVRIGRPRVVRAGS